MEKRKQEYNECIWSCRHIAYDDPVRTFMDALEIETKAIEDIRNRFSIDLIADFCKTVHYS